MPASLKWLALLVAASVFAAVAAGTTMYVQSRARTRMMAEQVSGGSVARGRVAMEAYGCGSCHVIPGIASARGTVGPGLDGIATRVTIAGRLPNSPAALQAWLRHPQAVVPGNAMPDQQISARDARDIAAYLYTLR